MHQPPIVTEDAVGAHQHVVGDRVAEHLDPQRVADDLFGFFVQVGVDERHVVVAGNAVPQGRQLLLHPHHLHTLAQAVPDVPQLVVGRVVGHKETFLVSCCRSADDAGAPDGGLDDWDEGTELTLEHAVEVVGATRCHQTVAIGELGKHSDVIRVFVLDSIRHSFLNSLSKYYSN